MRHKVYVFAPVSEWYENSFPIDFDWPKEADWNKHRCPIGVLEGRTVSDAFDMEKFSAEVGVPCKMMMAPIREGQECGTHICVGVLVGGMMEAQKLPGFVSLFMFSGFTATESPIVTVPFTSS
jgi:hypothetical protein